MISCYAYCCIDELSCGALFVMTAIDDAWSMLGIPELAKTLAY